MKILILCVKPHSIISDDKLNDLSNIYASFFDKYLRRYDDCQIKIDDFHMDSEKINNLEEYDFCIVTVNRGIIKMKSEKYDLLRKKIKYRIITICDNNKYIGEEDLLLYMLGRRKKKSMQIFWGADFDVFKPLKSQTINILVDHKYYGKRMNGIHRSDVTGKLIDSLLKYKNDGNDIIIRNIGRGRVNTVTDGYTADAYSQSRSMDFREISKYYNEAHIFVVTHQEGLGMSVIECAAAGALIVQPSGYIKKDIISQLHHYSIKDVESIDWGEIISKIDIEKSIKMSETFSYKNMIDKVHSYMIKNM